MLIFISFSAVLILLILAFDNCCLKNNLFMSHIQIFIAGMCFSKFLHYIGAML